MMEPWNDPSILRPPVSTVLHCNKIDVQGLIHACNNIIKVLLNQSPFHKESAILSRFLYKFDRKFRNDIGYRIFKKINTALKRYLTLNLLKDVTNFADVLPACNEERYLPTRQMLEYVIVRIMSFSKIMMRICICSKQASIYYLNKVKRGESHWMSLMPYALLSRIWSMSTVLLQHSCSWYSSLYLYLNQLQYKGVHFLPNSYTLPKNLDNWLDINNLDECGKFDWSYKNCIQINLNLAEDGETNFDTILEYVKGINNPDDNEDIEPVTLKSHTETSQILPIHLEKGIDQGVSISREYFQSFFNKQTIEKSKDNHSANNVTDKVTLGAFLRTEEDYRNKDSDLSLTKHLSFMQWHTLRTNLEKLGELLGNNRKIERKFIKIWKEKCLDYM